MIRGEKRRIETVHPVNATINAGIHNRFDVEVIDAETGEVKQTAVGYNVICDSIWARMISASTLWFTYIQYGGGSGTPSASDTSLFSYIGYGTPSTSDDVENMDYSGGVCSFRRKIQLAPETAVGSTITEVGIAYGTSSSGNIVTHAMLQDMNGNQISITKTATDVINIYATVYVHFAANGWDNGCIFVGLNYFPHFLVGVDKSSQYAAPSAVFPSPGFGFGAPLSTDGPLSKVSGSMSYDASNKRMTFTGGRFGVSFANSGIGSLVVSSSTSCERAWLQLLVGGSWFPGTQITGESIGTGDGATSDFSTDFPFVSNAKVYVDGVEDASATVDQRTPGRFDSYSYGLNLNCVDSSGRKKFGLQPIRDNTGFLGDAYYENPFYTTIKITSVTLAVYNSFDYEYLYCSDDSSSWTLVGQTDSQKGVTLSVPSSLQNSRYWKLSGPGFWKTFFTSDASATNIHFSAAPAAGAVITADYFTKTIAKDENHVFDLTVTIQLGEYSEE